MWSVNVTDSLTGPDGRATAMTFQASVLLHTHWRMKLAAAYLNCLQIQIWAVPLALEKPQQPEQRNDQPTVTKYAQVHHKNRIFWQWYVYDPTTVTHERSHRKQQTLKRVEKTTNIFNPSFPEQMDGISTGVHFDVHWFWSCQKCHTRKYADLINLSSIIEQKFTAAINRITA